MEEGLLPPPDHRRALVSSFLEVAVGHSADTARQFLDATGWKLDEALTLFYANGGWAQPPPPPSDDDFGGGNVRPPSPVEVVPVYDEPDNEPHDLWGFSYPHNENEDDNRNRGTNTNLADLYRPPYDLMFYGPFENSKDEAKKQDKWLLVNVQSAAEFASHVLNRDIWADETVAQIIKSSFVFWQYDHDTEEGRKVCTYYNLNSPPAVLVIDPITGRTMKSWTGPVQPNQTLLLEGLQPFLDQTPSDYLARQCNKRRAVNGVHEAKEEEEAMETEIEKEDDNMRYPDLPEEPLMGDANLICRVGVRLPDGRRLQRNFLRSDPVQLLWSFCHSLVGETDRTKPFRLTQAVPGASKVVLEYETHLSFEESGIGNSMVMLTWD